MKAVWISMLSICLGGAIFGHLPKAGLIASGVLIAIAATIAWFKVPQYRSFTPTAAALMFLALMLAAQAEWGVGSLANTLLFVGFGVMFIVAIFWLQQAVPASKQECRLTTNPSRFRGGSWTAKAVRRQAPQIRSLLADLGRRISRPKRAGIDEWIGGLEWVALQSFFATHP